MKIGKGGQIGGQEDGQKTDDKKQKVIQRWSKRWSNLRKKKPIEGGKLPKKVPFFP
ncbi:hypothetical protein IKF40_00095 [Candidatus Saccharibacteria bacterium]|nr:hypothetical protein [Candidatus Saccharibacteria bacterium]